MFAFRIFLGGSVRVHFDRLCHSSPSPDFLLGDGSGVGIDNR
jgi:hypothetical protein